MVLEVRGAILEAESHEMYEKMIGLFIAIFLAVGRWTPSRLGDNSVDSDNYLTEPRLWAIAGMLYFTSLGALNRSRLQRAGPAEPTRRLLLVALLSLFGFMALSILWTPAPELAVKKLYEVVLIAGSCLSLYICSLYLKLDDIINSVWIVLFVVLLLLAVMGIRSVESERLSVFGGGPNVFGRNMGVLFICCMYLQDRWGKALLFLPLAAMAVVLVLLSGSRGALLSTCTAILIYFACSHARFSKRIIIALIAILVLGTIFLFTDVGSAALERFQHRVVDLTVEQGYSSGRDEIASDALEIANRNPAFGYGLAGFQWRTGTYPHNLFLEILCDCGIVGLVLFGASLVIASYLAWQSRHSLNAANVAALSLFLMFSQFSGDFFDARSLFIFMLVISPDHGSRSFRDSALK